VKWPVLTVAHSWKAPRPAAIPNTLNREIEDGAVLVGSDYHYGPNELLQPPSHIRALERPVEGSKDAQNAPFNRWAGPPVSGSCWPVLS
jgi:hypothetical protein